MARFTTVAPQHIAAAYAHQTAVLSAQDDSDEREAEMWAADPDHASWVEGVESGTILPPDED